MSKLRHYAIAVTLSVIAAFALYGCGNDATPTPTTSTAPSDTSASTPATSSGNTNTGNAGGLTGSGADLLNKAQQSMKDVKSYHFSMNMEQSDSGTTLAGEGDYMAPDSLRMQISGVAGMTGTIETIIIGEDMYVKQPDGDQYMALTGVMGAGGMGGLSALQDLNSSMSLAQLAEGADLVGDETIDGVETAHVSFVYDVDKAMKAAGEAMGGAVGEVMTNTTSTNEKAKADIWVEKNTGYIKKFAYTSKTPGAAATSNPGANSNTTITITYSKIGEPVTPAIEKPTNIITMPGGPGGMPPGGPGGLPGGLPPGMGTPGMPGIPGEMGTPVP
jgi:outer membrane lipoprotein-sorting protein